MWWGLEEYEEPDKSQLFLNFWKTLVAHLRNTEFYDELDLFSVFLRCLDGQRVDKRAKCAFLWNTGCKCDIHQNETCCKMKQASEHPSICTFSTDAGFAPVVCNYTYTLCSFCDKPSCAVGYGCYQPIKAHFSWWAGMGRDHVLLQTWLF